MDGSRKTIRDKLMHSKGTTPYETVTVIVPTFFYTIITIVIISFFKVKMKNEKLQFFIEFVTLVIPIILNVTILADYAVLVLTTSCVICLSLLLFINNLKPYSGKSEKKLNCKDYITNSRSTINIISVIAILAVDFLIFPRRFAKTENFGYSLMDVGGGLFMFSNGIVDGGETNLKKSFKGSIPLLILGTIRLFLVKQIDYHVPASEYGVHWNFFITLAVTKIFVSLIFNVVNVKLVIINATLLMISHEVLLQTGLKNLVLTNTKRHTLILANKEGLVSSLGYVYLYLYSAYFSYFVDLKRGRGTTKSTTVKFILLTVLSLILSQLFGSFFGISRKLANAAYCFWVLFIGIFMTGLYYIASRVLGAILYKINVTLHLPLIFQAINYNGLAFFLISNVLTGLINIIFDSLKVGTTYSLIIIILYMLVNCAFVCFLFKKQIKLKL